MKLKWLLPVIMALAPASAVVAADVSATQLSPLAAGTLSVCLYPGFAPFAEKNVDGSWSGWDVDYLTAFAKSLNLTFEVVEIPVFDGIWNTPAADRCDIAGTGISNLQHRRAQAGQAVLWSHYYYQVARAYLVRSGDEAKLNRVEDLSGKTVIVTNESTAHEDLVNRLKASNITDVTIAFTPDETMTARSLRDTPSTNVVFAYGGGLGSVQYLASTLGGLSVVWPHCDMDADGIERYEPFSFVVRAASTGIGARLDAFIDAQTVPYPGGKGPQLTCAGGNP